MHNFNQPYKVSFVVFCFNLYKIWCDNAQIDFLGWHGIINFFKKITWLETTEKALHVTLVNNIKYLKKLKTHNQIKSCLTIQIIMCFFFLLREENIINAEI